MLVYWFVILCVLMTDSSYWLKGLKALNVRVCVNGVQTRLHFDCMFMPFHLELPDLFIPSTVLKGENLKCLNHLPLYPSSYLSDFFFFTFSPLPHNGQSVFAVKHHFICSYSTYTEVEWHITIMTLLLKRKTPPNRFWSNGFH